MVNIFKLLLWQKSKRGLTIESESDSASVSVKVSECEWVSVLVSERQLVSDSVSELVFVWVRDGVSEC